MLPLALANVPVTGAGSTQVEIEDAQHTQNNLVRVSPYLPEEDHGPVTGGEALSVAPRNRGMIILSRDPDGGERSVAVQPLCGRVSSGLHRAPGN